MQNLWKIYLQRMKFVFAEIMKPDKRKRIFVFLFNRHDLKLILHLAFAD